MIRLDADKRRALALLRRKVAEIEAPARKEQAKARQIARKARGKALTDEPGQRHERARDNAYLAHVRRQPCILAGVADECEGRIEATHLRFSDAKHSRINPGMGRKPDDRWTLAACAKHHRAQHAAGDERRWWSSFGIDPNEECLRRYAEFQSGKSA